MRGHYDQNNLDNVDAVLPSSHPSLPDEFSRLADGISGWNSAYTARRVRNGFWCLAVFSGVCLKAHILTSTTGTRLLLFRFSIIDCFLQTFPAFSGPFLTKMFLESAGQKSK